MRSRSDPGRGSGPARYPGSFRLAFGEAAAALGWRVERFDGDVAYCADATGAPRSVNLDDLYRQARRTPRPEWPALVGEFLRTLERA